jgi:hypothetical protein
MNCQSPAYYRISPSGACCSQQAAQHLLSLRHRRAVPPFYVVMFVTQDLRRHMSVFSGIQCMRTHWATALSGQQVRTCLQTERGCTDFKRVFSGAPPSLYLPVRFLHSLRSTEYGTLTTVPYSDVPGTGVECRGPPEGGRRVRRQRATWRGATRLL